MPYQMKSGKWRAERQIDGKRYTKTCETKRQALAWENSVSEEIKVTSQTLILTVLEWLNAYLDYANERFVPVVYNAKRRSAKIMLQVIPGSTPVNEITPAKGLEVMRYAAKSFCGGTANLCRKHLGAGWQWGVRFMGLPQINPFTTLEKFAQDEAPRRTPTEQEFWDVVAVAQPRDRRFLMTCLYTAARKGELFRLRWQDVDFERGFILLGTRKRKGGGMEYDPVPMTTRLKEILIQQKQEGLNQDLVFCHVDGSQYTTRERLLKRLCQKAGVEQFSLHGIRHLTASILAREGVTMQQIQAILRHKRLSTTERYISRIAPQENVLEQVFQQKKDPIQINCLESQNVEVPHQIPHLSVEGSKLQ